MNNINSEVKNTAADDEYSKIVAKLRRDSTGRFCLNDAHQILSGSPSSAPTIYLELPQTQELIMAILEKDGTQNHPVSGPTGTEKLLFVSEDLLIDFLVRLSPEVRRAVFGSFSAKHDDASMAAKLGQVMEQAKADSDKARATRKH